MKLYSVKLKWNLFHSNKKKHGKINEIIIYNIFNWMVNLSFSIVNFAMKSIIRFVITLWLYFLVISTKTISVMMFCVANEKQKKKTKYLSLEHQTTVEQTNFELWKLNPSTKTRDTWE